MPSPIKISHFKPTDQETVQQLINQGLGEHWGSVDPTYNPDLYDIAETYKNDVFLVARCGQRIIGTGALVTRSDQVGEIVRMSVAQDQRRQGIGNLILNELIETARKKGFSKIILETTETWKEVVAFYLAYGFEITHHQGGDAYFSFNLD